MARRSDHTREEQRKMALDAARNIVKSEGIHGLTARSVARRMGYTVGTLYLIFHNLDELIIAVNAQTVAELRNRMEKSTRGRRDPTDRLKMISRSYLAYALENPALWRLAIEHQTAKNDGMPQAIAVETDRVLDQVIEGLRLLIPSLNDKTLPTVAAAFWSGIHGVCHLALTDSLKVAGARSAADVLDYQVDAFLAGISDR